MRLTNFFKTTLICSFAFSILPLLIQTNNDVNVENNSLKNFEQDNILSLNNDYNSIKNMTSFTNVNYDEFANKNINIYYHTFNKQEVIYAFVKNVFIFNINKYLNQMLAKHLNISYPKFQFIKEIKNISNSDISLDYEFQCENKTYVINKNKSLLNMFVLDQTNNKITLNLSISEDNKEIVLKQEFNNFNWCEIANIFNYEILFNNTDIANISSSNINQLFQIYNVNPTNFLYDIVQHNNTQHVCVKNISYTFQTGIQKFDLVYTGKKIFEYKPIDVSISENNIIEKTNILKLDVSEINNLFKIGNTIKTINYTLNLDKDLYNNIATVRFDLYKINSDLIFKDLLNKLDKSYEIKIDFNKNHLFTIDINKDIKNKKLPISMKSNDIEIISSKPLDRLTVLSKYIKSFDNQNGTITVLIKYEYTNYFNQITTTEIEFTISNLLKLSYKNNLDIINTIKDNCYSNNDFDINKFRSFFLTSNKNEWLINSEDLYIENKGFEANLINGKLYMNFFISNIQNEVIYKDVMTIDLKNNIIDKPNDNDQGDNENVENISNNSNEIYKYIAISISAIVVLITIILVIIKLKNKSKIRLK